jgi:hypothetical protein
MNNLRSATRNLQLVTRHLPAAACLVLLLVIYLQTLPPSLTWAHHGADGGDLVTAVARGSIPHPPGFPTYLLLGAMFIRLPWGDPAWRLNLMSAALAAGAAALTAAAVRHWPCSSVHQTAGSRTQDEEGRGQEARDIAQRAAECVIRNPQIAICTGLSLGLSPLFWSQALITEVYAPSAFFAALVAVLALRGGPAWAVGLAWGIGMGAHPTLVLLAPLVAWGACADKAGRWPRLAQAGLLALLGWGAMYGPVLLARRGTPSPWGDVSTPAGWWALVSGRLYQRYLFELPLSAWPQRLLSFARLLARQFTPLGATLAALGWLYLWRARRALAGVCALTFGAFSLYAIGYNTADSLVYLVPVLPLAASWMGLGLVQAAAWLENRLRHGAWAILLLPLLQALLFWGQVDASGDRVALAWAERVMGKAPPQAVLLTAQDAHTFTLWYVRDVLGKRADTVIVDQDLWAHAPYRNMVAGMLGLELTEPEISPEEAARTVGRPVVRAINEQ